MNKIAIGTGIGLTVITVAILGIVYMDISTSGSRSEDGRTFNLAVTVGKESIEDGTIVTAIDENNDGKPIQLIAACEGEGTKFVSCTWIPLDEAKRTPEEKELAERAGKK
jgi:hypothetical protein